MLRSLWSGVTGLQAHQIAMDVEGNNIANVNTRGFKFARVSFADHISQTSEAASPPSGGSGGTNPKQVGLGASAQAVSRVYTQGPTETTNVTTDLAIENDGFFIISSNGGKSFKYTRNGQFKFDEQGNFVTNSGYIVQGWSRNPKTGLVDKTVPIGDIIIPKGLKSEAKASTYMRIKGNISSGNSVGKNISYISPLDRYKGGYDKDRPQNGITPATPPTPPNLPNEHHKENSTSDYMLDKDQNIIEAGLDASVLFNSAGESLNIRRGQGFWMSFKDAISEHTITATTNITAGVLKLNGQTINIQTNVPADTTNKAAYNAEKIADIINEYTTKTGVVATANGDKLVLKNDNRIGTTKSTKNIELTSVAGITGMADDAVITARKYKYSLSSNVDSANTLNGSDDKKMVSRLFRTTEDLRELIQTDINYATTPAGGTNPAPKMDVIVNEYGQFQIKPKDGEAEKPKLNIATTSYSDDKTTQNKKLTSLMQGLDGEISQNIDRRMSQSFYTTTNATMGFIYDSLGTKHSIRLEYTKINTTSQNGTEWRVKITCAEPGKLAHEKIRIDNNDENVIVGSAKFNAAGALIDFFPKNLFFTPNNGAEPNQNIKLDAGTNEKFDGITSYDEKSSLSSSDTDGYAGGDLMSKKIGTDGIIEGTFTNGKKMDLGQISMAKFTNNEGLESDGGNNYIQTSNSGDPIIGTANTGGRGSIKAGSLEMSNVDLSRSLTQLIVVQRGFQANSKTITTSDQMLNTLLQLKQ